METQKLALRALVIEDQEDDALLLINELKRGGFQPDCTCVDTPEMLKESLIQEWDVVFCDYSMPKMNGRDALEIVRQHNREVPFLFVSGTIGEDVAVEAMRSGAQDYIMKGNMKRLVPAVQRELRDARIRREQFEAEKRLYFLSNYDTLTRLPNRVRFLERLNRCIRDARDARSLLAVIHLDIDRFKTANDSLGYKAGDILLQEAARRLALCVSVKDVVARLAADEFAILLSEPESHGSVTEIINKIMAAMEEPFDIHGCTLQFHTSMGVAFYPFDAGNGNDLLRCADIATCRAKDEGGKSYRLYTHEMAVQLEEKLALEHAMQHALKHGEFLLHYQPQVELQTGRIAALEALVRWNRPGTGVVPPGHFIPVAEETGTILPLGEWVLRKACAQARYWRELGLPPVRVAVNVSARQFLQSNLVELVGRSLEDFRLESHCLELEITESSIMQDMERALFILNKIKDMGVTVALDDFGTGYSSLSYLKHFKVDNLKIDRSFIRDIPGNKDDTTITRAIIAMAGKLGIKVIAEGVETEDQYNFLGNEGCDFVQGYYMHKPMEGGLVTNLLQEDS